MLSQLWEINEGWYRYILTSKINITLKIGSQSLKLTVKCSEFNFHPSRRINENSSALYRTFSSRQLPGPMANGDVNDSAILFFYFPSSSFFFSPFSCKFCEVLLHPKCGITAICTPSHLSVTTLGFKMPTISTFNYDLSRR